MPRVGSIGGTPEKLSREPLDRLANLALNEVATLETTKDVTCWTSFRQLDSFIAAAQYSNFATLAKIAAAKALVRAAWEKASFGAKGPTITAADLDAAVAISDDILAEDRRSELAAHALALGMKAYKDYRTTSEHWRVVLSVLEDEILRPSVPPLKVLSQEALPPLADLATRLSLKLLLTSGRIAANERSPMIEGTHVKRAHTEIAQRFGLKNTTRPGTTISDEIIQARMAPLTQRLITGKIKALQTFNKDSKDLLIDINRVAPLPLDASALDIFMRALLSFTRFVVAGYEPMQSDNFLAEDSIPPEKLERQPFIDAVRAENSTLQLFPHLVLPNGDVKIRLEPSPAFPNSRPGKGQDVLILDYRQNAVRDTAIHWLVLEKAYAEKPFAMDPFAAEYVSEVVSTIMTYYLVQAERAALAAGQNQINATIAGRVLTREFVMVMPHTEEAKEWTPAQWKKKAAVLGGLPNQLFEDVTSSAGLPVEIDVAKPGSAPGAFDIQQAMGAGLAIGDLDRDGYPDLFLAGEGLGRLYRNRGRTAPGRFEDVTRSWGVPEPLTDARGALFFDMEGDGDLDLLIVRSSNASLLLRQEPAGHFTDVAAELGFATLPGAHVASIFDYDGDGDVDIYIGYYGVDPKRGSNEPIPTMDGKNGRGNQLWRREPEGKYREVGASAGVADPGWALATGTFDFDEDGDLDLVVANDFGPDMFYRNLGNGTFEDIAGQLQTDDRGSGMNVSFTDANDDGHLDFYVTNIDMFSKNMKVIFPKDDSRMNKTMDETLQRSFQYLSGNKLFINPAAPDHPFVPEQGTRFEPGDRGWSWAAVFFDYDNDGDEDMYLTNGWIEGSTASNQKNQMFIHQSGTYYLASPTSPEAFAGNSRSAMAVDIDRDGSLDLLVNNYLQRPTLLANRQIMHHHWLGIRLHQAGANSRAIGARLVLSAGGKKMVREISCGLGYLGQSDEVITFGLGKTQRADLSIRWPGGQTQTVSIPKVDRILDVERAL